MAVNNDKKFKKVVQSVEKTISIITHIIQKLEDSKAISNTNADQIVNACLNIAKEMRSIPFGLNEIEKILLDIVNSIHQNRSDLEESVNILINHTGSQLTKVTEATGKATSNIMDITDQIVEDQNYYMAEVTKLKTLVGEENADAQKILDEMLLKIQEDQGNAYKIWDFLQFQDITTQQIEYAYNLLREAESKLVRVSDRLGGLDEVEMELFEEHNTAYDPDADFEYGGNRQDMIDELINGFNQQK